MTSTLSNKIGYVDTTLLILRPFTAVLTPVLLFAGCLFGDYPTAIAVITDNNGIPLGKTNILELYNLRYGSKEYGLKIEDPNASAELVSNDQARIHRYAGVGLTEAGGRLAINFGAGADAPTYAIRLRYKLEGYDAQWRDHSRASMHMVLKFLDENRIPVSRTEFISKGSSVGWAGKWDDSKLSSRVESAVMPPRAAFMSIWVDSGGHDEQTGMWLLDNLKIGAIPIAGGEPVTVFSEDFEKGRDLSQAQGDFSRWVRDGGALEGAQVYSGPQAAGGHAMLLADSTPTDYVAWRLKDQSLVKVVPGQTMRFTWDEMYSLGWGRAGEAVYEKLPHGAYQLRVQEVDAEGNPTGIEATLPIVIAAPFYLNSWFQAALISALVAVGLIIERMTARVKMRNALQLLERKQELQQERARIARDIHDDLGTVLSRMSMISESASLAAEPGSPQQRRLNEICATSRQVSQTMEEIVWAQDPRHDSLDNTLSYFCTFASELLALANVACRFDIPVDFTGVPLEAEKRHELFRVFKEVLNNIVKHAGAKEVRIAVSVQDNALKLSIQDDGKGFTPEFSVNNKGNGLLNMTNRIKRVGGTVDIHSEPGKGATTSISLPLPTPNL